MVKNLPANARDKGSIPGSGRSPGGGNGHPLDDSCWDDPMDRGAWWAIVRGGHRESDTTKQQQSIYSLSAYHSPVMLNCFLCDLIESSPNCQWGINSLLLV